MKIVNVVRDERRATDWALWYDVPTPRADGSHRYPGGSPSVSAGGRSSLGPEHRPKARAGRRKQGEP